MFETLWGLFSGFFKIGLFSIGGGYAMIPLIQKELVEVKGYMTVAEVSDVVAISEMTPGPFAVNAATFAGMSTASVAGAIAATLGVVTPSVIICIILAKFFMNFQKSAPVQGVLYGVRPVVVGLIASAALTIAQTALWVPDAPSFFAHIDFGATLILAGVLIGIFYFKKNPILLILLSALAGMLLYFIGQWTGFVI